MKNHTNWDDFNLPEPSEETVRILSHTASLAACLASCTVLAVIVKDFLITQFLGQPYGAIRALASLVERTIILGNYPPPDYVTVKVLVTIVWVLTNIVRATVILWGLAYLLNRIYKAVTGKTIW